MGGIFTTSGGAYFVLPNDGDYPPADTSGSVLYDNSQQGANYLLLPDIDFGFPDELKIPTYLRLVADQLTGGAYISAYYAVDGASTYTLLGTFYTSPLQDIAFPSLSFRRISIKLVFFSSSTSTTPIMNAVSLRASINPKQYSIWSFKAKIPSGPTQMSDYMLNANAGALHGPLEQTVECAYP